jgi:hypothetical protein
LGIPLDLNIFNENVLHSSDGKFDTIAWTTLDDCRREFFSIRTHNNIDKNKFIELTSKYKMLSEFAKENPKEYEIINEKNWNDEMFINMGDYTTHQSKSIDDLLEYVRINKITNSHPEYKSIHSKIMSYAN